MRTVARLVAIVLLSVPIAAQSQAPGATAPAAGRSNVLAEVRVHGNHTTPDEDVLRIAGLAIGAPLATADIDAASERLRRSGRFEEVEIRTRYRSLDENGEIALIVLVREHEVPDALLQGTPAPLRPFRRLFAAGMFLPILGYNDGYGFTYGARFTFVNALGRSSRVSVPLTWGGTKRVAVEAERSLARGPIDRVTTTASLWRRANPFYEQDEDRREVTVGASRSIARPLRVGLQGGYSRVMFGALEERLASYGANVVVDTRQDPVFPRNAVYAEARWNRLLPSASRDVNQFRAEARAFKGIIGQAVLSLRWQYAGADGPLPLYERHLLGGAGNVRGHRVGTASGDNLMAGSVELRVPLSSPLGLARAGFSVFTDVGTVWDHAARLRDVPARRGVGGGVFLLASLFQVAVDVAVREGGGGRVHLSTGLQF